MDQELIYFAKELYELYHASTDVFLVKKNMKPFIQKLFDFYEINAREYFEKRKAYNSKMLEIANKEMHNLDSYFKEFNIGAEFVMTSSLNADINLVGDSDIDISMLVPVLDDLIMLQISTHLNKLGYTYQKIVNPSQVLNCYHSFNKNENDVEFEVKLRNKFNSRIVLELHKHMEQCLTTKERMAITYGKFLFKFLSKSGLLEEEKKSYAIFKKMVYEMYFAEIKGGFMLDLHY
ncbi:putative ORFan [Tupanvirus deep ocean]|uniref:ORFan n=2 Tax=Tupanvirus TaxID=2094720 RepID=A0AC62A7F8_9VIRU|nr:putative ORFan [Tupanvirus deep ocean]QKU33615.1 putative ORFan [Tupanvirus deep ocean]